MIPEKEIDGYRLLGEFLGTIDAVLLWGISEEVKQKLIKERDRLSAIKKVTVLK